MNPLFRRYGMRWTRRYPPIDWLGVLQFLLPLIVLILALLLAGANDAHNEAVEKARVEHSARSHAEANLAACLSGTPLLDRDNRVAFICQPGKEVQL